MPLDAQPGTKYGLHREPRLSAAQIADYLTAAGPDRRTSVIREARFPKVSVVTQYRDARAAIPRMLCDPASASTHLADALERLRRRALGATEWTTLDCERSTSALETFAKADNLLALRQYEFRPLVGSAPPLVMEGVDVCVSLDATVHRNGKVGSLLLAFAKRIVTSGSSGERLAITSLLSLMFAEKHLVHAGAADAKLCLTLHVGSGQLVSAPKSQVARRSKVVGACREIADRWRRVEPPRDYDGPDPG